MLKAIHGQESKSATIEKSRAIAERLTEMKLTKASKKVEESIAETLTYMEFPTENWIRIRTNYRLQEGTSLVIRSQEQAL